MYLRVVRAAGGKGIKHEYVRVVEAYREDGKNKHRTSSISDARICWSLISTSTSSVACCTATGRQSKICAARTSRLPALGTGDRCWWRGICGVSSDLNAY